VVCADAATGQKNPALERELQTALKHLDQIERFHLMDIVPLGLAGAGARQGSRTTRKLGKGHRSYQNAPRLMTAPGQTTRQWSLRHVRFAPMSGHRNDCAALRLCAIADSESA
jgi:hypothetical protein